MDISKVKLEAEKKRDSVMGAEDKGRLKDDSCISGFSSGKWSCHLLSEMVKIWGRTGLAGNEEF